MWWMWVFIETRLKSLLAHEGLRLHLRAGTCLFLQIEGMISDLFGSQVKITTITFLFVGTQHCVQSAHKALNHGDGS